MAPVRCTRPNRGLWPTIDRVWVQLIELISHLVAIVTRARTSKSFETKDVTPDPVKIPPPQDVSAGKQDFKEEIIESGAGFQAETVASAPSDYQEARHQWKNDVSRPIFKWHATDTRKQGELDIMQKLSANGEEPKIDDGPCPMPSEEELPPIEHELQFPIEETVEAAEATGDTNKTSCIVTAKGQWLLMVFDSSPGATKKKTGEEALRSPPPAQAVISQSATSSVPDMLHSSKNVSNAHQQTDNDMQEGSSAEDDQAKLASDERKHAVEVPPEPPGDMSSDVRERLPPDKGEVWMLAHNELSAGLKMSQTENIGAAKLMIPAYKLENGCKDSGQLERNTAGSRPTLPHMTRDPMEGQKP